MRSALVTIPVLLGVLLASGCLTQAKRNEVFSEGLQDALFESKMAEQYLAYVNADATLSDAQKSDRAGWIARVQELIGDRPDDTVAAVKVYTKDICSEYDNYIDADGSLGDQSKLIRKRSSEQVRKLIKTAEGP